MKRPDIPDTMRHRRLRVIVWSGSWQPHALHDKLTAWGMFLRLPRS